MEIGAKIPGEEVSSRILVYIGSRKGEFDRRVEELSRKAGGSDPVIITLGGGEDRALSYIVRGNYNIYFTKGSYGVIVQVLGTDDLVLKKITSEQAIKIILKELARNIAQSLPAQEEAEKEKAALGANGPLVAGAIVLLIIFGLVLANRREKG